MTRASSDGTKMQKVKSQGRVVAGEHWLGLESPAGLEDAGRTGVDASDLKHGNCPDARRTS